MNTTSSIVAVPIIITSLWAVLVTESVPIDPFVYHEPAEVVAQSSLCAESNCASSSTMYKIPVARVLYTEPESKDLNRFVYLHNEESEMLSHLASIIAAR